MVNLKSHRLLVLMVASISVRMTTFMAQPTISPEEIISLKLRGVDCSEFCTYIVGDNDCSSIKVNDIEYSVQDDGLNVAIIDVYTGKVQRNSFGLTLSYYLGRRNRIDLVKYFQEVKTNSVVVIVSHNTCSLNYEKWFDYLNRRTNYMFNNATSTNKKAGVVVGCKGECPEVVLGQLPYTKFGYGNLETEIEFVRRKAKTCPANYPFAYLNGKYCCATNKEKHYAAEGKHCDGSIIGIDSTCCQNDTYFKCRTGVCINYEGCKFQNGDGTGGPEINTGKAVNNPAECVNICLLMKEKDPVINGATLPVRGNGTCYCEKGMTGRDNNKEWQSCMMKLAPPTDTPVSSSYATSIAPPRNTKTRPTSSKPSDSNSSNKLPLILGATTAFLIILLTVIVVIIFMKRRGRCKAICFSKSTTEDNKRADEIEMNEDTAMFANESYAKQANIIPLTPPKTTTVSYANLKKDSIPTEYACLKKDSLPTSEYQCLKKESVQYDKIDSLPRVDVDGNEYTYIDPHAHRILESENQYYAGDVSREKSDSVLTHLSSSPGTSHNLFRKSMEGVNREDSIHAENFASYVTFNNSDNIVYKAPSNVKKFDPPKSLPKNMPRDSYVGMDADNYDNSDSIYQPLSGDTVEDTYASLEKT